MEKTTKLKTIMLFLAMAVSLLLPMTMFAQSDGFFRGGGDYNRDSGSGAYSLNNQQFGSDANGGYNLNNQTFGQDEAPLGTGLLIMMAAGIGYVAIKRKQQLN
ncbi:MAG: hypothetical protein IJT45_01990 [Bacteroidales bacterium]|nr:hypothetical protein [Bacteroidales bacterium]